MAQFAAVGRHHFINLTAVRVFVADITASRGECEIRFEGHVPVFRGMTRHTRDCAVGAAKRVVGLLMLGHYESGWGITVYRMALIALSL